MRLEALRGLAKEEGGAVMAAGAQVAAALQGVDSDSLPVGAVMQCRRLRWRSRR